MNGISIFLFFCALIWVMNIVNYAYTGVLSKFNTYLAMVITVTFFIMGAIDHMK